ncbi:MAG TPA: T9SS type A sorting domain-containing protein [Ignavibacteriaceae bacterium]|nr:T9SS type A sorting domain-containing protein [Ignavibacteriaceae bacterium]
MNKFLLKYIILFLLLNAASYPFMVQNDSIYFKNFVKHSDGSYCTHIPPEAEFTAFMNENDSIILIEKSPRWNPTGAPNIPGNGTFGVELGNFINPGPQPGDSVSIRFTCNEEGEQETLTDYIDAIPWIRTPEFLNLSAQNLPLPPQDLFLNIDQNGHRILTWNDVTGLTYKIYRRDLYDTLTDGKARMLYTRIAQGISGGSYTDETCEPGIKYGYILYAVNQAGIISSRSDEINEVLGSIDNLTLSPTATNVSLKWDSYIDTTGVAGYNIYRRKFNEPFGAPVGYTGSDTTFIDSRLEPGVQYFYKVKARIDSETEIASTQEVSVITQNSTNGYYTYANLKIAVVIYKNTNNGNIPDSDIPVIKNSLKLGQSFYWRNSKLKLNAQFFYYVIDDYEVFPDPDDTWGSMIKTANDLAERGVINTQYDIIFRITTAVYGYWSYGIADLPIPGPLRATGFSHVEYPGWTGVIYPGNSEDVNYALVWLFVHEVQHAIDAVYDVNGHPEMYHGDVPWEFPVYCGEQFDFQSKLFRTFLAYEDLLPNWGNIYEDIDTDNDGFPDNDSLTALDEIRFDSRSDNYDTDNDGLKDKNEAINGTYTGSNPNSYDTDGDGKVDGEDKYPRYPVAATIPNFHPVVDGVVEEGWPLIDDTVVYSSQSFSPKFFMSYTPDSLYLAFYLSNIGIPFISFEFQHDGWWYGAGNTQMEINISNGTFSLFHSWDASPEVREWSLEHGGPGGMWDDDPSYQSHFQRRVIYPSSVNLKLHMNFPVIQIEISIAKREYAGLNLQPGDTLGVNIYYNKVNNIPYEYATTFDQYDFAYFILGGASSVDANKERLITEFDLLQNYPNPFNPTTKIEYNIPKENWVTVKVYDILGNDVKTLVNEKQKKGSYEIKFDGSGLSSGVYFYTLRTSAGIFMTRKMLLLR